MVRNGMLDSAVVLVVCFANAVAAAEDWPRWRGPRGDGTWDGPPIAESWPAEGLERVWRQEVGGGYGGVAVTDGRLYVLDRVTEPRELERLLCFDADDGRPLWAFEWDVAYGDLDYGNGPRSTPTLHEGYVYVLGALGHFHALDATSGRRLWSKDYTVPDRKDDELPMWGLAASPVVWRDLVIVHPGVEPEGCLIAINRRTGAEVWRSLSDPAGYATPIVIDRGGQPELVAWTPKHIHGLDPATGTRRWSVPYEVTYGVSIATPIFHDGIVFVSGYWEGAKAIRLGAALDDAQLLWEDRLHLRGVMSQPLYKDGYGYLLDKQYGMTCFEYATGKKLWDDDNRLTPRGRNPQASLVRLADSDRVLALNSDGELVLASFTPKGYSEHARAKIIGETWAHPAFAGHRVYARSDSELVCFRLPIQPR
ncbi:MAG: PQQ-like beta-propeller repeat protein [Planctomycetes bacterium]|nr:PQQ-like beta-propeller repeat protein [Planctomycetota bacterium]